VETEELLKAIGDSGFPLQLGLQRVVASVQGWSCELSEHAWRDPLTGDEKFIDIIVSDARGRQTMVIECKRAKQTDWIFLRETPTSEHDNQRRVIRARVVAIRPAQGKVVNEWTDVPCMPASPIASFCVPRKETGRAELLEKTAAEVARATDAVAEQALAIHERVRRATPLVAHGFGGIFVPIIVTTARLFICDADYSTLDLESGEVPKAHALEVPLIRFQKSLGSSDPARSNALSLKEFADQGDRTVLIMNARYFSEFLAKWDISKSADRSLLEAIFL
jgi:hypothetical protein